MAHISDFSERMPLMTLMAVDQAADQAAKQAVAWWNRSAAKVESGAKGAAEAVKGQYERLPELTRRAVEVLARWDNNRWRLRDVEETFEEVAAKLRASGCDDDYIKTMETFHQRNRDRKQTSHPSATPADHALAAVFGWSLAEKTDYDRLYAALRHQSDNEVLHGEHSRSPDPLNGERLLDAIIGNRLAGGSYDTGLLIGSDGDVEDGMAAMTHGTALVRLLNEEGEDLAAIGFVRESAEAALNVHEVLEEAETPADYRLAAVLSKRYLSIHYEMQNWMSKSPDKRGSAIEQQRRMTGLTQEEAADVLGVSIRTWPRLVAGKTPITLDHVTDWLAAVGSFSDIMGRYVKDLRVRGEKPEDDPMWNNLDAVDTLLAGEED